MECCEQVVPGIPGAICLTCRISTRSFARSGLVDLVLRFVTYNRESACRFIDHYKDGLHQEVHPFLEAMLADCRGVINALESARDLKATEALYHSADGREALAAGVHAARDFLEAQIKTIDHLATMLGV